MTVYKYNWKGVISYERENLRGSVRWPLANLHDGKDNPETAHYAYVYPCEDVAQDFAFVCGWGVGGTGRVGEEIRNAVGFRGVVLRRRDNDPNQSNRECRSCRHDVDCRVTTEHDWLVLIMDA